MKMMMMLMMMMMMMSIKIIKRFISIIATNEFWQRYVGVKISSNMVALPHCPHVTIVTKSSHEGHLCIIVAFSSMFCENDHFE